VIVVDWLGLADAPGRKTEIRPEVGGSTNQPRQLLLSPVRMAVNQDVSRSGRSVRHQENAQPGGLYAGVKRLPFASQGVALPLFLSSGLIFPADTFRTMSDIRT